MAKLTVLCTLQALAPTTAFMPIAGPSPASRITARPVLTTTSVKIPQIKAMEARVAWEKEHSSSTEKATPTRGVVVPTKSVVKEEVEQSRALSNDEKRMFVRWSYLLCFLCGIVNSATLIKFGEVVMHMTGPSSKAPLFLAQGAAGQGVGVQVASQVGLTAAGFLNLYTVSAFLVGCLFAGLATAKDDANTPIKKTGKFMVFAGALLMVSGGMAKNGMIASLFVAACAGGMLNGLTSKMTTYRVSHVTGTVTDMGLLIGKGIRSTLDPALSLKLRDLTVLMGLWLVGGISAFWLCGLSALGGTGGVMMMAAASVIALGFKGLAFKPDLKEKVVSVGNTKMTVGELEQVLKSAKAGK